jgi:hypothetical protein
MPARPARGWAVALALVVVFALACLLPTVRSLLLLACILLARLLGEATRLPTEPDFLGVPPVVQGKPPVDVEVLAGDVARPDVAE